MRDISLCTGQSQRLRKKGSINLYGPGELNGIREAGGLVRDLLHQLYKIIKPGINELDISSFCENYILIRGGEPFLKSAGIYMHSVMISRNNKAYHGIPEDWDLAEGDIVTVDVVLRKDGWFGDGARTYEVGNCGKALHELVEFSHTVVKGAIESLEKSGDLLTVSEYVTRQTEQEGYRVLEEGAGHGIGLNLHEEPLILFGKGARKCKLRKGMVFTIEPVITNSFSKILYTEEGTAYVEEGCYASQFEHMVAFGEKGLEILTAPLTLFK